MSRKRRNCRIDYDEKTGMWRAELRAGEQVDHYWFRRQSEAQDFIDRRTGKKGDWVADLVRRVENGSLG